MAAHRWNDTLLVTGRVDADRAVEIERTAQEEAQQIRVEAYEAASRVLERIDSLEGSLGGLVSDLRSETSSLSGDLDRRS